MNDAYRQAGVDIKAGYQAVAKMKTHIARTTRPEVLSDVGGFAGLFALGQQYSDPVLVSGTDGVGTKLKIAFALENHTTIGIDLVAMCANDILVHGAEPLFFLDYLALPNVAPDKVAAIVSGVAEGCVQAGCALLGGETAEMPGLYHPGEYDLAGFCVGVVERDAIIDGSSIRPGDAILGLASQGLHSNGFSLVRKLLLQDKGMDLHAEYGHGSRTLGEELLLPTRIYVKPVQALLAQIPVKGMAHITGGGLIENIPRMLPLGCYAEIWWESWPVPPIFSLLQQVGGLSQDEMRNTFNVGIGYVLVVAAEVAPQVQAIVERQGEKVYMIGEVKEHRETTDSGPRIRFVNRRERSS